MNKPIKGMTQIPIGEEYMVPAWVGMVRHALGAEYIKKEFKKETGFDVDHVLKATGINAIIDQKTGYQRDIIAKFADWVTVNLWGVEE